MNVVLARLRLAFATRPTVRGAVESAALLIAFALVAVPVGVLFGMLRPGFASAPVGQVLLAAVIAVFVPSLFEETLYRALMLPQPGEGRSPVFTTVSLVVSTALFVVGHPLAAVFVPGAAPLFFDPTFLVLATLFGLTTGIAYLRTGSIWPPVAMHWVVVVVWVVCFGGWIMLGP